ncbi:MAG: threonine--tRNA ligase [Syntrophomonadaceae bacterium]|jgi:threonyl-tRNA synthetase|nr:threonine--tRNA ligase [Syntrophomonadaceae bacterium]
MIKISLKDGAITEYPRGITALEIAKQISGRLAREAVAARFNGRLIDVGTALNEDGHLEILTANDPEALEVYRHTTAHVMAQAVKRLYPDAALAIGPAIEKGFYYDFDFPEAIGPEELAAIEQEMTRIIKEDYPLLRSELSRAEACKMFEDAGEKYKVELIEDLPEDATISVYRQGEFVDLCAGPHLPSTGRIKAFRLMNLAGAYWRGDEKQKMLQRLYGTSFFKKEELDDYLYKLEEAKRRDHRKLGRELGLFVILDEGPGFPFFLPKGMIIRNELEKYWREVHDEAGYLEIRTPIILERSLWERSGHWDHYRENMYFTRIDDADFAVKPMNCPGALLVYKQNLHSYRELPIRLAEMGLVHRHEMSGVLHGLMRVRAFTQDDAHIFMLPEQMIDEITGVIELIDKVYTKFGFSYHVEVSTKPEKAMGSDEDWEKATQVLKQALDDKGMEYKINEGDGAFYGPKIDFHLKDSLDRTWQCGTIQLDFQFPELFDLTYIGEDGEKHRPVMIHRVVFGSMERFIGILTEHYAGAFPVWLAPIQARIIPITERHHDYANELAREMKKVGIRVDVDARSEKMGYKIREGQMQKIPYMLVVGDKEVESRAVSVRKRGEGDIGSRGSADFINELVREIRER